ncbi:MAG: phosphoenolpyruvate carboxykinase (GTP), partial [Verrucomicrobia bacterium]|nr:phosphoenolpyruvate carboxykinase (GTP) [Verrucomicrobiota bacterium]
MNTAFAVPAIYHNAHVTRWVAEVAQLCRPDRIQWCDGSAAEKEAL